MEICIGCKAEKDNGSNNKHYVKSCNKCDI